MQSYMKSMTTAASGMSVQSERLLMISQNVANADTPGYRRKLLSFEQSVDPSSGAPLVKPGSVTLDQSPLSRIYDPNHRLADETGHVDMSNVDLVVEIADSRQAQRSFEANLSVFDQARRMYTGVIDLLRR